VTPGASGPCPGASGPCRFLRSFRTRRSEFAAFTTLAEHGLGVVGDNPEQRLRLELMRDMDAFMAEEFPLLLDRWDDRARAREDRERSRVRRECPG
jgi:hypothetical protein